MASLRGPSIASVTGAALLLVGCVDAPAVKTPEQPPAKPAEAVPLPRALDPYSNLDPYPSTYRPLPSQPVAIVGATVLTATGQQIENGVVVLAEGRIVAVGDAATSIPAQAQRIDARGKWVTPGIIDAHSHLGVYPSPGVSSRQDGNEMTNPNTAGVWAEHSVWPQDPAFQRARAGGVTTLLILPGSGNLFGGRSVTLKNVPAVTVRDMKFPGAPYGLKMACGENPKRSYGMKGQAPSTAMGNVFGYRKAWLDATEYARKWAAYRARVAKGEQADAPARDLTLDTLAGVLAGEILIQNHCYRADEMATMIDLAHEFGLHIAAFHHAVEAYKIAPLLAQEHICAAIWGERGGMKMEAMDGIGANAALLQRAGSCVIIHSDDTILMQRLNQEAAIAVGAGLRAGIDIPRAQAIAWITANPAHALGIDGQVGTLEPGKMADVVLWSGDPFSVYTVAEQVFIDGALAYDRHDARFQPRSDFELGQPGAGAFHP
ncbi:MAG TPA: amidohydrolase [Steroidobacteraceae bacterium]|jgi:imidazolonepropionase-like amidohydrolase|nr:amidohydrolase [Steroidobacteraceae bacterium]